MRSGKRSTLQHVATAHKKLVKVDVDVFSQLGLEKEVDPKVLAEVNKKIAEKCSLSEMKALLQHFYDKSLCSKIAGTKVVAAVCFSAATRGVDSSGCKSRRQNEPRSEPARVLNSSLK